MLEDGGTIFANCDINCMRFDAYKISTLALDSFFGLSTKKPYVINLNKIECIVGEWNKEKTEYGLRVYFESGNSVWLDNKCSDKLIMFFNDHLEGMYDTLNLGTAANRLLSEGK